MTTAEHYEPGPAPKVEVRKDGDTWTLVLVRTLRQPPAMVWRALTDPSQLREWAPYDADRSMAAAGPVALTTVGAPTLHVTQSTVTRAEPPHVLEFDWGGGNLRWQLEPAGEGTSLTLWHRIDRRYISMGAAGWHVCLDVLDRYLAGHGKGRIVGPDAIKFGDWQRLNAEYAKQFGVETPAWPAKPGN
jgi:uncharacterized protein YndB with AHSA1/START domain